MNTGSVRTRARRGGRGRGERAQREWREWREWRQRRGQSRLRAGELAFILYAVCEFAFVFRARGACLGEALPGRIRIGIAGEGRYARSSPGSCGIKVTHTAPGPGRGSYKRVASAVAHARGRHDSGCFGLGVPVAELELLAVAWGSPGEFDYVLDAFRAAAEHMLGEPEWSAHAAAEVLEHEVRARITPELPTRRAVLGLRARRWSGRGPRMPAMPLR